MGVKASKIIKQAQMWIGCKESNDTHEKIIDIYNAYRPLPQSYVVKYTDDWCATFVSAVAIKCNATSIIPPECGCQRMIGLFQKIGAWKENDSYTPAPGDIVFYDWQDNGKGDNKGWADHVGIIEKVKGTTIHVIEGNKNGAVARRTIKINQKYIRGYGVPKYDAASSAAPIKKGDKVKLTSGAKFVNGKAIPDWLFGTVLYVRQIRSDGNYVISTLKNGPITGAVSGKYLKKV